MDSGFRRNDGSEYVGLIILTGYENFGLYREEKCGKFVSIHAPAWRTTLILVP